MRTLKFLFDFYLDASIHVSLSVIALAGTTFYLLDIPSDFLLLGFIFFGSIVCYNFVKYGVEAHKYLIVSNAYHKSIQIFSFLAFALAVYFLVKLSAKIWIAVAFLAILSTLYAVPMLPNAKNLRSLGGFKIYIVGLVWTGFTTLLPILDENLSMTWDLGVLFVQRFILVIILMLPFEIRDLQWDDRSLKTLPQIIGAKRTQALGLVLIVLFFLLTFLKDEISNMEIPMRLAVAILLLLIFAVDQRKQPKYFASFWVEGIPVIWLAMFWLAEKFA